MVKILDVDVGSVKNTHSPLVASVLLCLLMRRKRGLSGARGMRQREMRAGAPDSANSHGQPDSVPERKK